jgi:hypothetical protein
MMMEKTDNMTDMCNEPMMAPVAGSEEFEEPSIPYGVDFGYPRTLDELKAELHVSQAERSDTSKWMTSQEFWTEMRHDLSWL